MRTGAWTAACLLLAVLTKTVPALPADVFPVNNRFDIPIKIDPARRGDIAASLTPGSYVVGSAARRPMPATYSTARITPTIPAAIPTHGIRKRRMTPRTISASASPIMVRTYPPG